MIMESTLIFGDIEFQKIRVTCIRSSTKHSHELKHIHITFSMQIYANTMFFLLDLVLMLLKKANTARESVNNNLTW